VAGPTLVARGIARRYGSLAALEPTDLEVAAGELVVLVGPNGAGKSTLLALLAGALPPSEGEVRAALEPAAIGWAPQRPALYRRLSARENLVLFARLGGVQTSSAEELLAEFELPEDRRPAVQLSVGNQQRLNLALAFLGEPRVLLLDEPTASLDPAQRELLWERLARVCEAGGAVCFATQNVEERERADRTLELLDGRLLP